MTFATAKKKLKKLAKGDYHMVRYSLDEHLGGKQSSKCEVYAHNYDWHSGATWKEALDSLSRQINGQVIDENEQPKGEDDE